MPKKKKRINPVTKEPMTFQQKRFCELYVSKEFFGNGVESYMEAYNIDKTKEGAYESARTGAWRLLTDVDILNKINELLDSNGLNDEFVDKQTLFLITQNADFTAKNTAIKEYNKVRGRITNKIEHSLGDVPEWMKQSPNGSTA
jgi:phage terminase small subunit